MMFPAPIFTFMLFTAPIVTTIALPAPIVTIASIAERYYVQISYSEFHRIR